MKKIIKKNQFVIPVANAWAVKGEGNKKFTVFTDNRRDAITVAKDIAKRYESILTVYNKRGEIVQRVNYSKKRKTTAAH